MNDLCNMTVEYDRMSRPWMQKINVRQNILFLFLPKVSELSKTQLHVVMLGDNHSRLSVNIIIGLRTKWLSRIT